MGQFRQFSRGGVREGGIDGLRAGEWGTGTSRVSVVGRGIGN